MSVSVEEAVRIDGARTLALLLRVVLPLAAPVVASALILSFIHARNDFLLFGLMLTTDRAVPITVSASFSASGGGIRWGEASAVMVVSVLPPLLISLLAYRLFGL